jgi:hypothetical protein
MKKIKGILPELRELEERYGGSYEKEGEDLLKHEYAGSIEWVWYYPRLDADWEYRIIFRASKGGLKVRVDKHTTGGCSVEHCLWIPNDVLMEYNISKYARPCDAWDGKKNIGQYVLEVAEREQDRCLKISEGEFFEKRENEE